MAAGKKRREQIRNVTHSEERRRMKKICQPIRKEPSAAGRGRLELVSL